MANTSEKNYAYMDEIKDDLVTKVHKLGIPFRNNDSFKNYMEKAVQLIRSIVIEELKRIDHIKALDSFNKEFKIDIKDYEYVLNYIDDIIQLKMDNPNIPFENILLISNIRFSVNYTNNGRALIVDIPPDVYKFLIKNKYDENIINYLLANGFAFRYNFIEIYKIMLKIGRTFQDKAQLLDNGEQTNIVKYIRNKYNNLTLDSLVEQFKTVTGYDNIQCNPLNDKCMQLNISTIDMIYRVAIKNMSIEKAIEMGINDKDKYGLTYDMTNVVTDQEELKKVFYAVVREYMKDGSK